MVSIDQKIIYIIEKNVKKGSLCLNQYFKQALVSNC